VSEAEHFAAAVADMPAKVRRFFEREDPIASRRAESAQDSAERRLRESIGGWCGG
jgi:hypothetical protein